MHESFLFVDLLIILFHLQKQDMKVTREQTPFLHHYSHLSLDHTKKSILIWRRMQSGGNEDKRRSMQSTHNRISSVIIIRIKGALDQEQMKWKCNVE